MWTAVPWSRELKEKIALEDAVAGHAKKARPSARELDSLHEVAKLGRENHWKEPDTKLHAGKGQDSRKRCTAKKDCRKIAKQ